MHSKLKRSVFFAAFLVCGAGPVVGDEEFARFCQTHYAAESVCPPAMCEMKCDDGPSQEGCLMVCAPVPCDKIPAASCPLQYCRVVEDCAKDKFCLPKTDPNTVPDCGDIAYTGQDVECCKGLVKRCGFDYFDGTCNMTGKNSEYSMPVCIPCGDGKCTNFENHCNCPEDCKREYVPEE